VYAHAGSITLTNNIIHSNTAYSNENPLGMGGGVALETYSATLLNNTLVENAAPSGGGLWLYLLSDKSAESVLYNNLFWANIATDGKGADLYINSDRFNTPVTLRANNFNHTVPIGFFNHLNMPIHPSNLNAKDPLFVSPEQGDLQLQPHSPMINAGYPDTPDLPETNLGGGPRLAGGVVDIGAYEFDEWSLLSVALDGIGAGRVTSDPEGIDCGDDCEEEYRFHTLATLTATPATGSGFAGWGGACMGTGACTVPIDSVKRVSATFVPLTLTINDVSLAEGHSGTTAFAFTVSLSEASASKVTVNYSTADGTATTKNKDYTATQGTLTFGEGETRKTVSVSVSGDTRVEPDKTFAVKLANPRGATLADKEGLGTIINDDLPTLAISDVKQAEGRSGTTAFTFTVTLSGGSAGPVTVQYQTDDGTATAGSDYTATSGTLAFSAGQTSQTVSVNVNVSGDAEVEPDETFVVNLTHPSGATLGDSQGQGTIVNDDRPTLTVTDIKQSEGKSGTTSSPSR